MVIIPGHAMGVSGFRESTVQKPGALSGAERYESCSLQAKH
jgi:hypothetical protein